MQNKPEHPGNPAGGAGAGSDDQGSTFKSAFVTGYRPEIEGLRAVAILLVVLTHARVPGLPGGYVGVDVFFVLSGFLITALLLNELQRTGGLDMRAFYARRFLRLLPGLLFMLGCCSVMAAILLAPSEHIEQARSAAAASAWGSNLLFTFARLDYFGSDASSNLFLHTWSLGVEEQFYLIWPAFVLFLLGAWSWQGREFRLGRLRQGLWASVLLTLALSVFLTYTRPAWAFYMVPSRTWQFGLGALALMYTHGGTDRLKTSRRVAAWAGWIGLLLILGCAALLDDTMAYPGLWALIPSLGCAVLLCSCSFDTGPRRLLSMAPLESVGRVSYSWYLWHWPILLLGQTLVADSSLWSRIGLALLSLLLATLSFRLIEHPVRSHRGLPRRPALVLGAAAALVASGAYAAADWGRNATGWAQSPPYNRYVTVRSDLPELYYAGCDDWFHSAQVKLCVYGDKDSERSVLIVGDSIGLQWFPALASIYEKKGWRVLVLTKSSCPMVDQSYFYSRIGRDYVECTTWRDRVLAYIPQLRPDVIVMGSSQAYPFDDRSWREGTQRVLERASAAAQRVFVIAPTPGLGMDGPDCLARKKWREAFSVPAPSCAHSPQGSKTREIRRALEQAAADYPNVAVVDFNPLVCPNNHCAAEQGAEIVFRDAFHLTASYAQSLTPEVERMLADLPSESTTAPGPGSTFFIHND